MTIADRMLRAIAPFTLLLAAAVLSSGASAAGEEGAESAAVRLAESRALAVMDAFLAAFNASDVDAWADTLLFPHVRLASGQVHVYPDRKTFVEAMDMQVFATQTGWRYSTWDDMAIVQSSPDKVHVRVRFSRFDDGDALIASYDSLYIIEQVNGQWGVRARSSFAP